MMENAMSLLPAYTEVRQRIVQAALNARRDPGSLQLIAVSKTFPAEDIRELYGLGQRDFGENYIQEWWQKTDQLADCPDICWHIIGQVQSNKSRYVAERAHWLHTLDNAKLARRLNNQRPEHLPPLQVCIEINIAQDANKHGIAAETLEDLAREVVMLPRLKLRGLMCVAQADADETVLQQQFSAMRQHLARLQTIAPHADTLSMGMSGDLECAIACGATMVRIGTALFGRRHYPK